MRRRLYYRRRIYSYDFTLICGRGGLLPSPRLDLLLRCEEEAHYCKQSGHHGDYKHMWARRGTIKVSFGAWRMFKNLEINKHARTPMLYQLSVFNFSTDRCLPMENKSWQYGNHLILSSASPSLYHFELFVVFFLRNNSITMRSVTQPFSWLLLQGWPQTGFRSIIKPSADWKKRPAQPPTELLSLNEEEEGSGEGPPRAKTFN